MSSEVDPLKTNEFIQRRKLRLQQVREQSKEIAKKIRQRAKIETLQIEKGIDAKKEKEYLECQKKFVNRLQEIYTNRLQNVGTGHKNASEHFEQDDDQKQDKSKLRGKEAVAAVRKKKQEILNKKKQLLDRKLQAREAANELSREKSTIVAKNLQITPKDCDVVSDTKEVDNNQNTKNINDAVKKVDMATQSNLDELSNDCQADIPLLKLAENGIIREEANDITEKLDKTKKPNLFALSDEMPSSLRGGLSSIPHNAVHVKPSLTLVSEYLQNRRLHLRETDTKCNKKQIEDLKNIKQTILRTRASKTEVSASNKEYSIKTSTADSAATRKSSVVMYNHSTRDTRTLPCNEENLVVRDHNTDDDAYSKAQKEETNDNLKQRELQDKIAEKRNRIAMTKQNVDKEYRDTLAFLNSLPKDMSNKPIKKAYMGENRQQQLKENHQRKLQQEFKTIEKECRRHPCKHAKPHIHSRSNFEKKDFHEYSWMPVTESEGNLAIHTIPTSVKEHKHGNTVKFSKNDNYHEYRSRHKHTPPTKDIPNHSKLPRSKCVETVLIEQNGNNSTDCSSITSDSSSTENLVLNRREKKESSEEFDPKLSDADRIIIYKILNSKKDKKKTCHKRSKAIYVNSVEGAVGNKRPDNDKTKINTQEDNIENINKATFEKLTEGIYKAVNENGDNVTSLHLPENPAAPECVRVEVENNASHKCCLCVKENVIGINTNIHPTGTNTFERPASKFATEPTAPTIQPLATASSSSLKAAANNETNHMLPDNGYIKLIDEGGQENGKFYVGAKGFLKDEAYEVIIQLRKKGLNVKDKERDEIVDNATIKQFPEPKSSENENTDTQSDFQKQSSSPKMPTSSNLMDNQPTKPPTITNSQAEDTKIDNQLENNSPGTSSSPGPKKATSTYTQTTNSPIQRPVFMHMSSSTSTAYMSPPEIILPRFLRQDSNLSCDETFESIIINKPQKMQRHVDNKDCRCKHHADAKKRTPHAVNIINHCKKFNYQPKKIVTPPNTVRSVGDESVFFKNNYETTPESCDSKQRGTCGKCENRRKCKINKGNNIDRHFVCNAHKNSPILRDVSSSVSHKRIRIAKPNLSKRSTKNVLNPIIKQYVNTLLELNKEGMKAVEIINEECSSVQTPSSSIINDTFNINAKISADKKISLEQIKNIIKEKIINDQKIKEAEVNKQVPLNPAHKVINKSLKMHSKLSRRKQLHKVKSLNISRKIYKTKKTSGSQVQSYKPTSSSSSLKNGIGEKSVTLVSKMSKITQKGSMSPRNNDTSVKGQKSETLLNTKKKSEFPTLSSRNRSVITPISIDSENVYLQNHRSILENPPAHTSTQTSGTFDSDANYMKVAEGKLQNMEKIADLTEKCTKRLSNLAKVLEEVRRNKSLAYSQITTSDSTSDSDLERNKKSSPTPSLVHFSEIQSQLSKLSPPTITSDEGKEKNVIDTETFIPFLSDIPKPSNFNTPLSKPTHPLSNENISNSHIKSRGKPPPALSRIHLKNEQEDVIPHELSTVLEVDSPMSLKLKSKSRNDINAAADFSNNSNKTFDDLHARGDNDVARKLTPLMPDKKRADPDLLQNNTNATRKFTKTLITDSSDDSKLQMMDLKLFNEIMLKPFISIQEYAKTHNVENHDEASNVDDPRKDALTNDDLSSLHSEGSLPDVIAELLKRKIISEPFKFDTASNVNSSTISSESTISVLALSNVRKERKKSSVLFQNRGDIPETSDTLSISSNPDLENAFKKLGMGWASSTLKKTKERLALSSSSNTSSSSGTQLRGKTVNHPPVTSDSIVSLIDGIKSPRLRQNAIDTSKNAEQQTSLSNSMTVKEFLTNELAKRIMFANKSTTNVTDREFVSLYETKMPEEMKQIVGEENKSANSVANCTNNRARTSTPVHIFKSMTYHSTSSSNTSNGLFSNADDLSSVKVTSNSIRNHSTSDKDDLTIPNYILKMTKGQSDRKSN